MAERPIVVAIGGPNGAGKTTVSRSVLAQTLGVTEFVNADTIAAGLSGFDPAGAAIAAGRVMLTRLRELAEARQSFAFESTLASRTFARWLVDLGNAGYEVHILFIWLRSVDLALRRVRARVRKGGHHIPEFDVRRRYSRSAGNLLRLYAPLAEQFDGTWRVYDNSERRPILIAHGGAIGSKILDTRAFARLTEAADGDSKDPAHGV